MDSVAGSTSGREGDDEDRDEEELNFKGSAPKVDERAPGLLIFLRFFFSVVGVEASLLKDSLDEDCEAGEEADGESEEESEVPSDK